MRKSKFLCAFVMSVAGITLILATQFKARDLGAPPIWLGGQAASNLFMYVVGNFFIGRLIRKWPRRMLLLASPVICLAAGILAFVTTDFRMLPLILGLSGLGGALFWAPLEVSIAEETHPRHLAKSLGLFNVSWTAAYMLAPPICGRLYDMNPAFPYRIVFVSYVLLIGGASM